MIRKIEIKVKKQYTEIEMPKEATEGSAGLDIVCTETTTIEKGQVVWTSLK